MVPLRGAPAVAATSNSTGAVPLPVAPVRSVIHGASVEDVQGHSVLDARTSNAPDPPAWPKLLEGSDSVKPHSAAAWVTSTRCWLRITPPRRTCGSGLG